VDTRRALAEGAVDLPTTGAVRAGDTAIPPFIVVDGAGQEIEAVSQFLRDLALSDASPLTCRSYGHDLLRWWRLLEAVDIAWDRATRAEVEILVGWLRCATNPQRARSTTQTPAGAVNTRTGKASLSAGYSAATINHALSVISAFYAFHLQFGRGPLVNPVPEAAGRRRLLAHRSPLLPEARTRRAPLRQKAIDRAPRSIPEAMWDELFAAMGHPRDRALLAFYVSSGARASELLGLRVEHVDWAGKRIWVRSKGTRSLDAVPASPEAFQHLAAYLHEHGTPEPGKPVWRALRGESRPLTYWAMRRIVQRANDKLATNWTLHDLRHTAAARMAADPHLTLPEVQMVLRHKHLTTTQQYLQPRAEELFDKLQEHYGRPTPPPSFPAGYDPDDFTAVFGG
jgi:integrase